MLPFSNIRLYNRNNFHLLQPFIEKMKNNQLTIENILEEDEIVQDLKTNQNSQFLHMISKESIRKLIDYATKMPTSDDRKVGHKYPFNAAELLSCDNNVIMERIMNEINSDEEEKEEKEEEKRDTKEKEDGNEESVEVKENENNGKNEKKSEGGETTKSEGETIKEELKDDKKKGDIKKEQDLLKKLYLKYEKDSEKKDIEAKKEESGETKAEPKGETKEEPKGETKAESKGETKEEPKGETKEEPKKE